MGVDGEISPEDLAAELIIIDYSLPHRDLEAIIRACDTGEDESAVTPVCQQLGHRLVLAR